MSQLISLSQIQEFKGITSNINEAKSLVPFIYEAQEFDLRPFLGEELYLALLDDFDASPSLATPAMLDLYSGSDYTDTAGVRRQHPGIVAMLVYFTHARYIAGANVHSTKHGMKVKENDWSTEPSEKTIARMIGQARSGAVAYQERVKRFLDINAVDYPLWKSGAKRRRGQIRLTAIGGNARTPKQNQNCISIHTVNGADCGDDYVDSDYVE